MLRFKIRNIFVISAISLSLGCLKAPDPKIYSTNPDFEIVVKYLKAEDSRDIDAMMDCIDSDGGFIDIDVGIPKKRLREDFLIRFSRYKRKPIKIGEPYYLEKNAKRTIVRISVSTGGVINEMDFSLLSGKIDRYYYKFP